MDSPIAYLIKGKDYLNPKLEIIVDEAMDLESKEILKTNLEKKCNENKPKHWLLLLLDTLTYDLIN